MYTLRPMRFAYQFAVVCWESPLMYTLTYSERIGCPAVVCWESPLMYTEPVDITNVPHAVVCWESPLMYTGVI